MMISDVTALSGSAGSHCVKDATRKQILQINATRERKRTSRIFSQKSVFPGKIPSKYHYFAGNNHFTIYECCIEKSASSSHCHRCFSACRGSVLPAGVGRQGGGPVRCGSMEGHGASIV